MSVSIICLLLLSLFNISRNLLRVTNFYCIPKIVSSPPLQKTHVKTNVEEISLFAHTITHTHTFIHTKQFNLLETDLFALMLFRGASEPYISCGVKC